MKKYKFPLQSDPFSLWDKIKASWYILSGAQLTQGQKVQDFELELFKKYGRYPLLVSSGSSANHLIAEFWKQRYPKKFKNHLLIGQSTSWATNISPFIMSGYNVKFCDINLQDFCFDYDKLEEILKDNKDKNCIIWPTALIGFCPDFARLQSLANKYKAELWGDFCEAEFCTWNNESIFQQVKYSSCSFFWSHMTTMLEGGVVFFGNIEDYQFAQTLRNHGMVRTLVDGCKLKIKTIKENPTIDPDFLFASIGANWRTTNLNAVFGLQDFKRADQYKKHRKEISHYFAKYLSTIKYHRNRESWGESRYVGTNYIGEDVALCLPIISYNNNINIIKSKLEENGWQTRPIIAYLPENPAFIKYGRGNFPNSKWLHENGCYVGINNNLTEDNIVELCDILNSI